MENDFSNKWKSSVQPRKQRKYVFNAPLHKKSKMLGSHLSKELIQKYAKRTMRPITGDKVKVMVGTHKGKVGKIEKIDTFSMKASITGIDIPKKDGSKSLIPIHVSNLKITELNLEDKKRKAILERNKNDKKTS